MSYFGETLRAIMARNNMRAVNLAKQSGVSQPTLSRYLSGAIKPAEAEDVARLAQAITPNPAERAELIRARLLDECKGPGSELIQILITGEVQRPAAIVPLNDDLEADLLTVREWLFRDKNVCEVIQGLANLLRNGDCRVEAEVRAQTNEVIESVQNGLNSSTALKTQRNDTPHTGGKVAPEARAGLRPLKPANPTSGKSGTSSLHPKKSGKNYNP